jgi:spoIIIJ-associated protein
MTTSQTNVPPPNDEEHHVSDEQDPSTDAPDPSPDAGPEAGPEASPETSPEGVGEETAEQIADDPVADSDAVASDVVEDAANGVTLEQEGDIAADYLEELLDIADLDGDIDMDVEGDRAAVSIVGGDLDHLVGSSGEVLDALQELTRLAVYRETGERSRLMLDIGGYRADKRASLEKLAAETAERVRESGEPVALDPMSPFERKVVHDAVAAAGLVSDSEGVEPHRYVVIRSS